MFPRATETNQQVPDMQTIQQHMLRETYADAAGAATAVNDGSPSSIENTASEMPCVPMDERSSNICASPELAQQLRFPWKLHVILEKCESDHASHATAHEGGKVGNPPIGWLPDGKSFKVHDKKRFETEVMPTFFGTQSFKAFQRNLNLW